MASGAGNSGVRALWPVLVIAGAAIGGWFVTRAILAPASRPNILLISIDTCRPDHLSCYGYPEKTTPHLDALAAEGVLFRNVITPVPITLPAHCSLMTGTLPPYHGVHGNIRYKLRDSNLTLAEGLKEHGYATSAVVGAFMMDPKFGLDQGFDHYDANFGVSATTAAVLNTRSAGDVNRVAKAWLAENADAPFFLFLHYYDPHHPYQPPEPFAQRFPDSLYAGEIAYVDHCIGEIISELKRLGQYDSTMIIVTADHGEALGGHGEATHGFFIYHDTTKIPLIIKPVGGSVARIVEEKVALVDIFPSIYAELGLDIPEAVSGRSLSSYLKGLAVPAGDRFFFTESLTATHFGCSSLLGLESRRWKYIQTTSPELYDLVADPGETHNLIESHPQQARQMRDRLKALLAERTQTQERVSIDAKSLARLESLGYVGGTTAEFEFETGKDDPKAFLPYFKMLTAAGDLIRRNPRGMIKVRGADGQLESITRYELARRLCGKVLTKRPDIAKAHAIAGRASFELGDLAAADFHYTTLARLSPNSPEAQNDLGFLRGKQGRLDEAVALHRKALQLIEEAPSDQSNVDKALKYIGSAAPVQSVARLNLADILFRQGKIDEAALIYEEALQLNPGDAKAHYVIGLDQANQGRHQEAIESFRKALQIKPNYAAASAAMKKAMQAAAPP